MSQDVTLQVAETRFAIKCNLPSFEKWLVETFSGFITEEKPHLRFDLRLDSVLKANGSGQLLTMTPVGIIYENNELVLRVASSDPTAFFWLMLKTCLLCAFAAKQPPDLLLHSSGVIHGGMAYIFTGQSGSGKSTVCKLLASDPSFTILHDEVIAISQTAEDCRAWSTPLRGEMPAFCNWSAPLKAIFFLKQDRVNYATMLSHRKAAELLCYSLIPPQVADNGRLVNVQAPSLKQLLALAEMVRCYELHFRPEPSFWRCIPKVLDEESVTIKKREEVYGQR